MFFVQQACFLSCANLNRYPLPPEMRCDRHVVRSSTVFLAFCRYKAPNLKTSSYKPSRISLSSTSQSQLRTFTRMALELLLLLTRARRHAIRWFRVCPIFCSTSRKCSCGICQASSRLYNVGLHILMFYLRLLSRDTITSNPESWILVLERMYKSSNSSASQNNYHFCVSVPSTSVLYVCVWYTVEKKISAAFCFKCTMVCRMRPLQI